MATQYRETYEKIYTKLGIILLREVLLMLS